MAHDALHIQEELAQNHPAKDRITALMDGTPAEKRNRLARLLSLFIPELSLPNPGQCPQID